MRNSIEGGPKSPDKKNCPTCKGTGKDSKGDTCKTCRGSGNPN